MRKCINGHIGFGKIRKCKKCGEILLSSKIWRKGKILHYAAGSASRAYKIILGKNVYVLKVVLKEQNRQAYEYAKKEVQILQKLEGCEHIVRLVNSKIEKDAVYILEKYYEGISQKLKAGYFDKNKIVLFGMDICRALIECREKGIYQLDIQPRNLYIDNQGRGVLGDFSVALYEEELESSAGLRGSLGYMAPEAYYHQQYSEQSEIYSLGLVLYCLLNQGVMPFTDDIELGDAVHRRISGEALPFVENDDWMNFINKACAFDREERFATFEECFEALGKISIDPVLVKTVQHAAIAGTIFPSVVPSGILDKMGKLKGAVVSEDILDEVEGWLCASDSDSEFEDFDADEFAMTLIPDAPMPTPPAAQAMSTPPFAQAMPTPPPAQAMPMPVPIAPMSVAPSNIPRPEVQFTIPPQNDGRFGRKKDKKLDKVQFSAVAPKEFVKGEYTLVNIFMYEEAYKHVVDEHIQQADTAMSSTKTGFYEVEQNVNVKIVLSSPDIQIEDAVEEGVWTGRYLDFSFAVEVPDSYVKRQILFIATVYVEGVITTKLKFVAKMTSLREQKLQILQEDILSVFVSYASRDRQRVAQVIQGMKKARPEMDVFFDVNSLRSGEDWERILRHEIENRDILFLCWSKNAKASEWVSKEWHYALENKGVDSIEPIPLEPPTECPPPEELKHKHFNDSMLFIINSEGQSSV